MRRVPIRTYLSVLLLLFGFTASLLADPPDTATFQLCLSPSQENPPIVGLAATGIATVNIFANRNSAGAITSAVVDLSLSVTGFPANTNFTGLHIHNQAVGLNGPVVISFVEAGSPPLGGTSTGNATFVRRLIADPSRTALLRFITGLLNQPELYYLNLHTSVNPGGALRAQLAPSRLVFRTPMTPSQEVPAIEGSKALAVATTTININRDCNGIASATVDFNVDFDFTPGPVTITGLHIHRGAAGENGPVVLPAGLGSGNDSITDDDGVGSIFRRLDIPGTNTDALNAVRDLIANPGGFYVNLHTSTSPGGAVRGQLSRDNFTFLKTMLPSFEVPPITLLATRGRGLVTINVTRDGTGNITSATVTFNVDYSLPGESSITGLHIHNAAEGVNGGIVIDSGISSANPASVSDQNGNVTRTITIGADNPAALAALQGILSSPERFYINLHTVGSPSGLIRSQLDREAFVFKLNMRPENEVPPVAGGAGGPSATAMLSIRPAKDAAGKTTVATVDFDVPYNFPPPVTFTGLHIHEAPVGVNGPIVIDSGISSGSPVIDQDGIGVLYRRATIAPPSTAAIDRILSDPENFYVNLHTTQNPGGAVRAQLAQNIYNFSLIASGGGLSSTITLKNPSATSSASGIAYFLGPDGTFAQGTVGDAAVPFVIPPSGTLVLNTNTLGLGFNFGYAQVVSSDTLVTSATFNVPGFPPVNTPSSATSSFGFRAAVVELNRAAGKDVGISVVNTGSVTTRVVFSLVELNGRIRKEKVTINLAPGQQISSLLSTLFPGVDNFTGTLRIGNVDGGLPQRTLTATVFQTGPSQFFVVPMYVFTKTAQVVEAEEESSRIYQ